MVEFDPSADDGKSIASSRLSYIPRPMGDDGRALNFIVYDKEKGFSVGEEARDFLMSLRDENIGVIAVAGKYRTGKSFLLNRILLQQTKDKGFGVGPTINPCTKGLWIWNQPIELVDPKTQKNYKCLVVDSEGIGAFNED